MRRFSRPVLATVLALSFVAGAVPPALAQSELRIALQDDPDSLDPALNWTFVGRHVLQSLCDKLVDIDQQGAIVPMLATAWSWSGDGRALTLTLRDGVTFHDGATLDAEAVKFNFERMLTMRGSRRRSEVQAVERVEVVDSRTVKLVLKEPSVPLLAALTDRAGMMVSPKAARDAGDKFSQHPVCAGPYRFVEHRAQDRLVLERWPGHWRASAYKVDRLVFRPIPDSTVRLLNLRSGSLDLIERLGPGSVAEVEADPKLRTAVSVGLGYYGITFNMANGDGVNKDFAGKLALRQAFDLAIDREAINQVAFAGRYQAGNQPFAPGTTWYDRAKPVRERDLAAAKAKVKEAGVAKPVLELLVPTDPERQQVAQMVQAMVGEAGIELRIQSVELISLLARARRGDFQAHLVGWSGRVDPDLNITPLLACGAAGNDGKYCSQALEKALAEGRATADVNVRKVAYDKAIGVLLDDLPLVYLYHAKWIFAFRAAVSGFKAYPDGIIRLDGVEVGK